MQRLKGLRRGLVLPVAVVLLVPAVSSIETSMNAQAATKAISFKQAKSILKRGGYGYELQLPHLKSESAKRTVITTLPGARSKDTFTLVRHGKYVKISALFGTLDGGHFTKYNNTGLPTHKTVLAKAPAWHTGTPKVLRHKWVSKTYGWHFYKNHVVTWDRTIGWVATAHPWINVTYQRLSKNKYKTHVYCPRDGRHYTATWKLSPKHQKIYGSKNTETAYRSN
ncbi:hypothetical protein [Lactiplantibacillus songbeiensis]|uniref:Extracellular protein n=1 Tax=Lactiplantibacillus songbeiensis TaxID=2559920 RepID=A0ABW4C6L2_9LACO|nr:hypothetical protein [Lactiplantibacillus songbeiensis]